MNTYRVFEDGYETDCVVAKSDDEALHNVLMDFDEEVYRAETTVWVRIIVRNEEDPDEELSDYVTVYPSEPDCVEYHEHDWQSPYSVVGGCRENPGVYGHGGGVIITTVCRHCGKYMVEDSWAQDPETGQQGLDTIAYREADEASLAWIDDEDD